MIMSAVSDVDKVQANIAKMRKASKVLAIVFDVLLGVYVLVFLVAFVMFIVKTAADADAPSVIMQGIPLALVIVIGALVLFVLARAFRDVSKSQSPFTHAQARRITIIGCLLLVCVVLEAVASTSTLYFGNIGKISMFYSLPADSTGIYLDAKLLVAAIVCFCLSYLFRYGAFLQWLSDETL